MRHVVRLGLVLAIVAALALQADSQPAPPGDIIIGQFFYLTVTKAGNGQGTIAGPGINCGSDCSEPYAPNTVVTITATASGGGTFTGWSGACSGTGACQLTMSQARAATATFTASVASTTYNAATNFSGTQGPVWYYLYGPNRLLMNYDAANAQWQGPESFALILASEAHPGNVVDVIRQWRAPGTGSIRITGTAVDNNTACGGGVAVSILKNTTSLFSQALANGNTTGIPYDITTPVTQLDAIEFVVNKGADGNNSCDATGFNPTIVYTPDAVQPPPQALLMVSPNLASAGTGTITGTGINCGTDCTEPYAGSPTITLTATPNTGSTFTGWSGACSGTGTCQVAMSQAQTTLATFGLSSAGGPTLVSRCQTEFGGAPTTDGQECVAQYSEVVFAENFQQGVTSQCLQAGNCPSKFKGCPQGSNFTCGITQQGAPGGWNSVAPITGNGQPTTPGLVAFQPPGTTFQPCSPQPCLGNPNSGGWIDMIVLANQAQRTMFFRYYFMVDPDFDDSVVNDVKIWETHNPQFASSQLFLGHYHGRANSFEIRRDAIGSAMTQNVGAVLQFTKGTWNCLEFGVTMNTQTGSTPNSDGNLQGWIDGVLKWNYPNTILASYTGGTQTIGFFKLTNSGMTGPVGGPISGHRYVDRIILATSRIGC